MTTNASHFAPVSPSMPALAWFGHLRHALVTTALALGAIALFGAAFAISVLHVSSNTVLTGSMRGAFDPGAVVLSRPVPVSSVKPGDVLVFVPPGKDAPYTHRVVTVTGDPAHPVITTKGDANPAVDDWQARLDGDTVPRVFASVPHVGRALLALNGRVLHTVLLASFGTALAVAGTRLILGSPRPRRSPPHP